MHWTSLTPHRRFESSYKLRLHTCACNYSIGTLLITANTLHLIQWNNHRKAIEWASVHYHENTRSRSGEEQCAPTQGKPNPRRSNRRVGQQEDPGYPARAGVHISITMPRPLCEVSRNDGEFSSQRYCCSILLNNISI